VAPSNACTWSAPEPFDHGAAFEFDAARDVGAGAWRALGKLRATLGIGP
jgi:hypothetical protein